MVVQENGPSSSPYRKGDNAMRKDYAIDATLSEIRQRLVDGMLKIFIVLSIIIMISLL